MQRPGQNIKTRTINVDGIIEELQENLKTRLTNTVNDWYDDDMLNEYLVQDLETYKGSIELMYKLDFIDKERWNQETDNGYEIFNKWARKTA